MVQVRFPTMCLPTDECSAAIFQKISAPPVTNRGSSAEESIEAVANAVVRKAATPP